MTQIKLIGLDLDGTVLTNQKEVTARTRQAIQDALAAGIEVVYVTGRPLAGIPQDLLTIPGIRYVITSNGALTRDLMQGTDIRSSFVEKSFAEAVTRIAVEEGMIYNVFAGGYGYSDAKMHERICAHFRLTPYNAYVGWSKRPVRDIFEFIRSDREGIENIWIYCDSTKDRDRIHDLISLKNRQNTQNRPLYLPVTIVRTTPVDVEVGGILADKGLAMEDLAHSLHIDRSEIMAIGDSGNDLGFMMKAGVPVAMANAEKRIRDLSVWVTDDNEHDGVAAAIYKYCAL